MKGKIDIWAIFFEFFGDSSCGCLMDFTEIGGSGKLNWFKGNASSSLFL